MSGHKPLSGHGGRRQGAGRKKGVPNVVTGEVRRMVLEALGELGGVKYLVEQGHKNPATFMALVGRIIPHEITGPDGGPLHQKIEVKFV